MKTQTKIVLDRKFDVSRTASVYPTIGKAYMCPSHSFICSPRVVKTGKNYYDSLKIFTEIIGQGKLPSGAKLMTQAEGLAIERSYQKEGKDPRSAEEFKDYFAKNKDEWNAWEWTLTGLRVPKGWENGKVDKGTGKYPRIVLIGDKECGELQVPAGGGKVIVELDDVFGIPSVTKEIPWPHRGYYAHWWFNPSPDFDKISGHYDIAVGRGCGRPHNEDERCLPVDASYGRWYATSDAGFRPVQGLIPEIEVVYSNVDVEKIKREIFRKARSEFAEDLKKLPMTELMKKYRL
jgi:hypothetical protein